MNNAAGVSRKTEDAYSTGATGPFSQFLVESKLLMYFCHFVCIILVIFMFFVVCICFYCLVFVPGFILFMNLDVLNSSITPSFGMISRSRTNKN